MPYVLRYVTHSEIGPVRKNNQDSGFASPHLLVVADGMGGAAAGDLASAVAVDTLKHVEATDGEAKLAVLEEAIHAANVRIADLVEADPALDGMGTTVTSALFDGVELGLAHIGDSRAYLLREGQLERLTHDHSWVQSLVDDGKISEEEAAVHPHRSLLLKVLNGHAANDPDLTTVPLQLGDRLMFCSDGVCGLVDDTVIAAALRLPELDDALDELVAEALAEGGIDNITVIVADVSPDAEEFAPATDEVVVLGAAAEREVPAPADLLAAGVGDDIDDSEDTVIRARPLLVEPAPAIEDEARYNPQAPHRRRWVRPVIVLVVFLLIAGAGLGAAYAWTRSQYFVGAAGEQVAIFRGMPEGLPGISLSEVFETQLLKVADLPPYDQDQVRANIVVSSLTGAREAVARLTDDARRCATGTPSTAPSPSPTSNPTASSSIGTGTGPGC